MIAGSPRHKPKRLRKDLEGVLACKPLYVHSRHKVLKSLLVF